MSEKSRSSLQAFRLPRPLRLSLLWASMMFLYVYNDYFSLYLPGTIEGMMAGTIGPLGDATEAVLLGVAILMTIPALMVFLSAGLPAAFSKWLNVGFGAAYTCVNIATFFGSALFYQFTVSVETVLSIFIVASALTWPKSVSSGPRQ
ncbi:MAG: DUF6326 family protein [Terricaulis sp.]